MQFGAQFLIEPRWTIAQLYDYYERPQLKQVIEQARKSLCGMETEDGHHPLAYQQATSQHAVLTVVYAFMGPDQAELVRRVMEHLYPDLARFIDPYPHVVPAPEVEME